MTDGRASTVMGRSITVRLPHRTDVLELFASGLGLEVRKNMMPLAIGLLLATAAFGGPPLICERIEIGTAQSLPWKGVEGWQGTDPSYDLKKLTADTLALLTPGAPVAVRMETMRRAAIYAARDSRLAEEIALRLTARVLDFGTREK